MKGTVGITRGGADDPVKRLEKRKKGGMFKNYALFTDCMN